MGHLAHLYRAGQDLQMVFKGAVNPCMPSRFLRDPLNLIFQLFTMRSVVNLNRSFGWGFEDICKKNTTLL